MDSEQKKELNNKEIMDNKWNNEQDNKERMDIVSGIMNQTTRKEWI